MIFFKIKNNILENVKTESSGLGIENVKKRLELLYPNQHDLIIEKAEDQFFVSLRLEFIG